MTPDAILVPKEILKHEGEPSKLSVWGPKLVARYRDMLGSPEGSGKPVHVRGVAGVGYLLTLSPNDSYLFPTEHPLAKSVRYDFVELTDGAKAGYLKPEVFEQDEEKVMVAPNDRAKLDAILKSRGIIED
jgi:hypothetical protein